MSIIVEYEQREAKQSERLDSEVQRHIECLRRLRTNIEDRDAMRGRKEQYRYHKAQMEKEKEEFDKRKAAAKVESRALAQASLSDLPADAAEPAGRGTKKDTRRNVQGTLTAVINSLDKLVDLERRISSLEKDSIYDRMDAAAGASEGAIGGGGAGPLPRTNGLQFSKRKTMPSANEPSRTMFAVRLAPKVGAGRQQLARTELAAGEYEAAEAELRACLEFEPQNASYMRDYARVLQHPSEEDMANFVRGGERSAWPHVEAIRASTAAEIALTEAAVALRGRAREIDERLRVLRATRTGEQQREDEEKVPRGEGSERNDGVARRKRRSDARGAPSGAADAFLQTKSVAQSDSATDRDVSSGEDDAHLGAGLSCAVESAAWH